jgi:uncharacterized membrane protein
MRLEGEYEASGLRPAEFCRNYKKETKPHARQVRRSVRLTLLLMVLIPLAIASA